jgi:hypothetical protein
MFPSAKSFSFPQQVIDSNKAYPCPRCPIGTIEAVGPSEALECSDCGRQYIALFGGHYLHPANRPGWKIMPIFWWDGFHWHRCGNTATKVQLVAIAIMSLLPAFMYYMTIHFHLWNPTLPWCHSLLPIPAIALGCLTIIWLASWDFDFLSAPAFQTESKPALPHGS